jgi:hypothetical protein
MTKTKETKGRSSEQTPSTIKPKQLALKKQIFNQKKYFPIFKNKFSLLYQAAF